MASQRRVDEDRSAVMDVISRFARLLGVTTSVVATLLAAIALVAIAIALVLSL